MVVVVVVTLPLCHNLVCIHNAGSNSQEKSAKLMFFRRWPATRSQYNMYCRRKLYELKFIGDAESQFHPRLYNMIVLLRSTAFAAFRNIAFLMHGIFGFILCLHMGR